MRKQILAGGGLIVLAGVGGWLAIHGRGASAHAQEGARPDRQGVELTVYAQDFGMVHEIRPVQLAQGANKLHLASVSRTLDPQSVLLDWKGDAANLPQLVSNSYDLGVQNGDSLLKRYLGQTVEVVRYGNDGHEAERQKGTLMVQNGNDVVLQSGDKFYVNPQGSIVAPIESDIVTIPQLSVQASSQTAQAANLDVTYLTRGLSWSADYVAVLSPHADTLNLECWATVVNRTGVDYPNAKISLMAGAPNRAVQDAESRGRSESFKLAGDMLEERQARGSVGGMATGKRSMVGTAESVGDNYAYPIKERTTVVQDQMNRLLMINSPSVSVIKDYSTRPPQLGPWDENYYGWGAPAQHPRGHVQIALTFANGEKEGLGQPLPAGAIRIYEPDQSGSLRYAGAAGVSDTPRDQKVNITLAQAFDVFTEFRVVKSQRVGKHTLRKQVELTLHNEKKTPVPLRVVQTLNGEWKIVSESNPHRKLDAQDVQWIVTVPPGGKIPLTYAVDFKN